MLRRTFGLRVTGRHTLPTMPKHIDKPGLWGAKGGPPKDTLARRWEFYRNVAMHKIGTLTAPFKTDRVRWGWRKLQVRVWKGTVLVIVGLSILMVGNMVAMMAYQAYTVGPSTPVLERKVREHRVSKQIIQMVRERERDVVQAKERDDVLQSISTQQHPAGSNSPRPSS